MNSKGVWIPGVLAVLAAALYVIALTSREKALARSFDLVEVLVARTDLPERTVLRPELVDHISIPRKYVAQDAFEYRLQSDLKLVDNLVTQVRIAKGNQILQSSLVPMSPEAGLSTKVPPGYRGVVVPVDSEMMAMIKPGDRVDILLTFDAVMRDNRREKATVTILQSLLVLAVGRNLGQGLTAEQREAKLGAEAQVSALSDKGAIGVALSPLEFQYLALAQRTGDISIGLRGLGDTELHQIEMASLNKLFR